MDLSNFDRLLPFLLPLVLIVVLAGVALWRTYSHTRMLPMCWRCGAWKVNPCSMLSPLTMLIPVRCQGCLRRFYTLRGVRPRKERPAWQMANRSLRYVDHGVSSLGGLFTPLAQTGAQAPLPPMTAPRPTTVVPPAVAAAPPVTANTEHAEQLANLLEAIVVGAAQVPREPEPEPAAAGRKKRRQAETAGA